MYIWVILATFLAMLASYSLSVRPDMRAVTVEPVAGAVIGKMVVQHRAARSYVKYCKYPYTGDTDRNKVDFEPGEIDEANLVRELPYGYELAGDYVSKIFCVSQDMSVSYDVTGGVNPCDDRNNKKLLVTFGPIPQRWLNLRSPVMQPNGDYMNAMRSMVNAGEHFGYMAPADAADVHVSEENPSGSDVRLVDRDGTYGLFLPLAVVEDSQFKSMCNVTDKVCLVYMSNI